MKRYDFLKSKYFCCLDVNRRAFHSRCVTYSSDGYSDYTFSNSNEGNNDKVYIFCIDVINLDTLQHDTLYLYHENGSVIQSESARYHTMVFYKQDFRLYDTDDASQSDEYITLSELTSRCCNIRLKEKLGELEPISDWNFSNDKYSFTYKEDEQNDSFSFVVSLKYLNSQRCILNLFVKNEVLEVNGINICGTAGVSSIVTAYEVMFIRDIYWKNGSFNIMLSEEDNIISVEKDGATKVKHYTMSFANPKFKKIDLFTHNEFFMKGKTL